MEEMVLPVLELIQFVDTRWSSEYNMLSRLHAVRKAVGAELANSENNIEILTEVEWKQAAGIVEVLGPLADATKEISGDNKALKSRFSFYDSDPIFCPSMLCDPRFRGVLIDDMVAVNTLAIEVKKLSDKSSLEPNVKDEHPSCSSSSSGLWSSFDSIPNTTQPAIDNNSEVKDYLNEPRNNMSSQQSPATLQSAVDREKIYQWIVELSNPETRENALLELSKKREVVPDLAPMLWHSFGTIAALLQEIVNIYPAIYPATLTAHQSNRVCNALALLQCVASHPETRSVFLTAHVPLFLYPFLHTVSKTRPFEYLRLTSLGVIGALVKTDEQEVITFLLTTEIIPLCLRIMESGSELSKTVATFILQKILLDDSGLSYICQTYDRFSHVAMILVSYFLDDYYVVYIIINTCGRCDNEVSRRDRHVCLDQAC
uniref:CCR4-NOT transcription complex subunit 9 n=1 Tax=Timema californicum TaxID=61474 RepID=A0A7R9J7W1_TIMCA|nr:unnamed protein product [Timema californicum]